VTSEAKKTEKQEVILERIRDPGFSLRAILAANRIIKRKLEESDRVKRDLSRNISPFEDTPPVKITHLKCDFLLMDDGLFLVPGIAILEGGGFWNASWSVEEIKEFRVLLQA